MQRALAESRWKDTSHVFTSTIGTPIDDRKILKEFNTLVEAAKLPKQRFHDLRQEAKTEAAAKMDVLLSGVATASENVAATSVATKLARAHMQ